MYDAVCRDVPPRRTIDVHHEASPPSNIKFYDREYLLFIVL